MKKTLLLILMTSFGLTSMLIAQDSDTTKNQNGTIYLLRYTGFGASATGFKTFIDGQFVCKLNNNKYSIHEVTPGKHFFSVQIGGKKSKEGAEKFEITVEPEGTYYIQVAFGITGVYWVEVSKNNAINKIKYLEEDTKCQ